MGKKKVTRPGKGFIEPFAAEPDWYKTRTYEEVFEAIRKDIKKNNYKCTYSAEELKPPADDPEHLTKMLKLLVPWCPDLFESDNPSARKLAAHFGRLLNTWLYSRNHEERQGAKDIIDIILSGKTKDAQWSKKYIQPLLSLNDMITYIHKITGYLRKEYVNEYDHEPLNKENIENPRELERLKKTDHRLVALVESGYMEMLINSPKKLTKKLVADFLGLTLKGLEQKLKNTILTPST